MFEIIDKSLAVIKPAEQRIVGWQKVLPPIFNWEQDNLNELKKYDNGGELDISTLLISTPTVSDIPKLKIMDDMMKNLGKLSTLKTKERKEITAPITDLISNRLMLIEKTYDLLKEQISKSYIALKKVEQIEKDKANSRNQELTSFRSNCQTYFNNQLGAQNLYIQSKVTEAYKNALELVEVEDAQGYLDSITDKHQPQHFTILPPKFTDLDKTDVDKMIIWKEIIERWDAAGLSKKFDDQLTHTFSDFIIAKKQKEEALKLREAEQVIESAQIVENIEIENVLVEIEAKAEPAQIQVFEVTRDLKKVYGIDMEHNEENMRQINKAFYQNMKECLAVWQGKDCWTISTVDQGNLLCKLKNKDNKFQPDGVVFKEIDKI